jgi:hypothetical protein
MNCKLASVGREIPVSANLTRSDGIHKISDFNLIPDPFKMDNVCGERDAGVRHNLVLMEFGLASGRDKDLLVTLG